MAIKQIMAPSFELGPIRPPSEAYSLLIRATRNCPWNRCKFCSTYKEKKFQLRPVEEIKQDIKAAKAIQDKIKELSWKSGYGGGVKEIAGMVLNNPPNEAYYNVALWLYAGGESAFLQDANCLIMRTSEGNPPQYQQGNKLCQVKNGVQKETRRVDRAKGDRSFPAAYRDGVRL